jgi:hypothetical protein
VGFACLSKIIETCTNIEYPKAEIRMDLSKRKEEFSYAYAHAIASVAGYGTSRPLVDNDSIDIQFLSNTKNKYVRSPRIEAQLKATAQDLIRGEYIHYPLEIKNYNDLRDSNVVVPRILICILLLEDSPASWLNHTEEMLSMMKCGYWMSLKGYPPTENTHSVTIEISVLDKK